jgi:hypothetical protein
MSDWTRSETISPPDVIVVKYAVELSNGSTEQREQILYSTTRSESISIYDKINYSNADGMPQIAEVAIKKVDTRFTTIASVNQAYVAYRLSKSLGLPIGEAKSENITISEYKTTVNGPVLTRETVLNYDSLAQFAGGLQVQDYSAFQPSGNEMILTHKTERVITLLTSPEGRDITKTETSRWMARGETQEGRNDFSIMYNSFKRFVRENPAIVEGLVRAFVDLVFEGTEVQIETGRIPVPIKPPDQEIIADEVIDYGNSSEREQSLSGARSFGPGGPGSTVQSTFDMPFAPDDYFIFEDGERVLVPGSADDAAECFGRTEAALDAGHAFGHNIVTGWNEIPTLDLSPVYIRQAGLEVAFLTDSTSYAWDGQGMVVSSDLMLLGVTGWYGSAAPATSWAQLPVAVAGLRQVTAGTTGTASKANSVTLPSGFDARNPGPVIATLPSNGTDSFALYRTQQQVIGPTLEVERHQIATGALVAGQDLEYALLVEEGDQVALASGLALLSEFSVNVIPAAQVVIVAHPPRQVGQPRIEPAAAEIVITAHPPRQVGMPRIEPPAAQIVIAAHAPQVVTSTDILVPAAQVVVTAHVPDEIGGAEVDPFFADVTALLRMNSFADSSSLERAVTAYGGAVISTTVSQFDGASAEFDGDDSYVEIEAISTAIGDGDFTAECWFRTRQNTDWTPIFHLYPTYDSHQLFVVDGDLIYMVQGEGAILGPSVANNTWHYAAVVRTSGFVTLFLNGNLIDESYEEYIDPVDTDWLFDPSPVEIGRDDSREAYLDGFVDEFRLTEGVARYAVGTGANAGKMVLSGTNTLALPTKRFPGVGPES